MKLSELIVMYRFWTKDSSFHSFPQPRIAVITAA